MRLRFPEIVKVEEKPSLIHRLGQLVKPIHLFRDLVNAHGR